MSPQEWFWELEERLKEADKDGAVSAKAGGFSSKAWDDARKKHKEKMNK